MNIPPPAARRFSLPLLLTICGALLLPGCSSRQTSAKFTAIRASTYRGETLAEYVARGPIHPVEGGYQIHAVERRSGAAYSTITKYPLGWDTTVLGPRIHHWRTTKPDWLAEWEEGQEESWAK